MTPTAFVAALNDLGRELAATAEGPPETFNHLRSEVQAVAELPAHEQQSTLDELSTRFLRAVGHEAGRSAD
jgi:hypothetical protein